ncbi:hypothetical protein EMCG_03855 [[Emmonsia] crescens]|uniref:Uncharacterized protein n=1 Tax=[Emmonsia] crescens TaxID=73230 RepID=A0A0G2IZN3_9EURO|nr:hypothetical protein EMCG_03855 [Emmonsia crescens UAMH 3008]
MADSTPKSYYNDPTTLYLYTSLTAGSSHIITATSRLETILKANKIPFQAIDVATDEEARKLWGRRSRGKKLPGLVRDGMIVGDLEEIEEWNEYGELKMQLGNESSKPETARISSTITAASKPDITPPSTMAAATSPPRDSTSSQRIQIKEPPSRDSPTQDRITLALRQAGEEAASKAKENTKTKAAAKLTSIKAEDAASPKSSTALGEEEKSSETAEPETKKDSESPESPKSAPERIREIRQSISAQRPSLSSVAAESTPDMKVNCPEGMSMSGHHHGSVVSATSPGEEDQLAEDLSTLHETAVLEDGESIEKPDTAPAADQVEVKKSDVGDGQELPTSSKDEGSTEKKEVEEVTAVDTSKD